LEYLSESNYASVEKDDSYRTQGFVIGTVRTTINSRMTQGSVIPEQENVSTPAVKSTVLANTDRKNN
jgi:hypothetical protein